ncbi:uncharacterized protein LOC100118043 [Nasonia vitripennis]|uniref:Glucosidase II beta subunit N-terminal domain-containing protein n=1 Tax=Nasonia vitripennis TaxID=7425 RepID=A0A7M7M2N0_NASVI|nr:uncharacterized protein LOC100118043 [Nasonia vitripennis]
MLNAISWWNKIVWKKWKYILLGVTVIYVLIQIGNMSILGFVSDSTNTADTKHRQHAAVKKILSKWEAPQHSKLMKDPEGHSISLRGTHDKDIIKYFPNSKGKFVCFSTKEELDYIKVNDDYCDCPLDGSDEPGTSACNNGVFYCEKVSKKSAVKIPSYKVNDGVCDCCDGSDEWLEVPVLDANNVSGDGPLSYRITQCNNLCKDVR